MELNSELWLPCPVECVFPFFADPFNLAALTPPALDLRVLTPPPVAMRVGTRLDYRFRLHGVPIRWQSEVTVWDPPHRFVDEQRRGPYTRWRHTHTFVPQDGGTLVRDEVEYDVPFALVSRRLVARDLSRVFHYRSEAMLRIFGSHR